MSVVNKSRFFYCLMLNGYNVLEFQFDYSYSIKVLMNVMDFSKPFVSISIFLNHLFLPLSQRRSRSLSSPQKGSDGRKRVFLASLPLGWEDEMKDPGNEVAALSSPDFVGSFSEKQLVMQPHSQGLSSSHKREWSTTPSCGKRKDPGNEVVGNGAQ